MTVIDRQDSSGKETSFANAGQISYGYSSPWAALWNPFKSDEEANPRACATKSETVTFSELVSWATKMLANCGKPNTRFLSNRMLRWQITVVITY
ncbi:hypothetical protein O9929_11335 [Vibrio lentus]|nr:hypothetical protein [Vibrio lentus]